MADLCSFAHQPWRTCKETFIKPLLTSYQNTFVAATRLPQNLYGAATVQYMNSFLVIGGYNNYEHFDSIIRYNEEDGTWETLPQKLYLARYWHSAVLIPSC